MGITRCSWISWLVLQCFFQAEDGIRDLTVTGVQTCALPISTTRGAGRCARMTDTACAMAAPFASEAPPNLWISRGRLERGMVNLKNSKARAVRAAGVAF